MLKKFIIVFISVCSLIQGAETVDLLFVLQDAGETQALLPVITLAEKNQKSYRILAGGVAQDQLAAHPHLLTYASLDVSDRVDRTWKRDQKISSESLSKITSAVNAKKVVSGVAFEFQGQILQAFAEKGSKTAAYWDNINPSGTDPYFAAAQKVATLAQKLLVPSEKFKSVFPDAHVVGQPSYEVWKEKVAAIDAAQVRAKLPLKPGKTILFVGGYGKEYEEAFDLFLLAAKEMEECNILFSFHPKMGGAYERTKSDTLLIEVSTMEGVAIADQIVCHQSTVGVQAASIGKPVFYLVPPAQTYTNPVIETGLALRLQSAEDLIQALQEDRSVSPLDFYQALHLPENSAQLILQELGDN
jgi:hypothetical protein